MRKHVQKLLNHQRDILAPQAVEAIQSAIASSQQAVAEQADKAALEKQMENLEKAAQRYETWIEERAPGHIARMREFMKQMRPQTAKAA